MLDCDLLVIGSGAAGLTAAVTAAHHGLRVIVAEKAPQLGGTSAWSGGWLWIPRNPLARAAGIDEPPEDPRRYLQAELGPRAGDPRLAAFLDNGPEMVDFLAKAAAIAWIDGNKIPDFHEGPGAGRGGRSVSVAPYDGRALGPWITRLRPPLDLVSLWGAGIGPAADLRAFFEASRSPGAALYVARRLARIAWDRLRHGRPMRLANGNALVARLMRAALDKGVVLLPDHPALALRQDAKGRVIGADLAGPQGAVRVHAHRGTVLATGGFPHDPARLQALAGRAGGGAGHHSAAPRSNSGDGLRLAEALGAQIDQGLAWAMAMAPVSRVPDGRGGHGNFPHLIERAKPGIIAVTPAGRRFTSEADSYHDFMRALIAATPEGAYPTAWLIADHRAQRRWGLGWAKPFPFPLRRALRLGYLRQGRSLGDLARACGIDPATLAQTVARFNAEAAQGRDPEFHRGESAYNRIQGDSRHGPNPSLAPLSRAPFYAVQILPGSLGSFAGLKTDAASRVLDGAGQPIAGLHAVGADMASVMGGHYPAGGITLGPGMTFGYIAGRLLAGQPVTGLAMAGPAMTGPAMTGQTIAGPATDTDQ